MKKNLLNNFIIIVSSIITLVIIITEKNMHISRLMQLIVIFPVLLIPKLMRNVFKFKIPNCVETLYLLFLILAYVLGIVFNFYGKISFYDKLVHFLSGFISSFLAIIVLVYLKKYDKKSVFYNILFIILVTLSVACLWEMFEFTCDFIFDRDAQKVLATGVSDTMEDMICAFLASILFSLVYAFEIKNNKNWLFTKFINSLE